MHRDLQELSELGMPLEAVYKHYGLEPGDPDFMKVEALHTTESVEYIGRAVVALASDPHVSQKTGQLLEVGALAVLYGFTDIDGRRLPPVPGLNRSNVITDSINHF